MPKFESCYDEECPGKLLFKIEGQHRHPGRYVMGPQHLYQSLWHSLPADIYATVEGVSNLDVVRFHYREREPGVVDIGIYVQE